MKQAAGRRGAAVRWQSLDGSVAGGDGAATGIVTINPATAPSWLRAPAEQGAAYVADLLALLQGKDVLHHLAGDVADAHTMYRAALALAVRAKNPKKRTAYMSEARGWLREHRTALATLSALAGDLTLPAAPSDFFEEGT